MHQVITVSLMRKTGRYDDDVGPVSDFLGRDFRSCADLPGPGHGVTCDWIVAPCVDGIYRAEVWR